MTSLPDYLWHGTTAACLENILRTGLDPAKPDMRDLPTSLTSQRKIAAHFGMLAAHKSRGPTVLIRVPSAALDTTLLGPDATLMISPFGKGFKFDIAKIEEQLQLADRYEQSSWQESLAACSGVIYRAPIPVTPGMIDISTIRMRRRSQAECWQIEVDGIEPEDCLTPAEPIFVDDPLALAMAASAAR